MSIFGKVINYHHDDCLVVGFRESCNEMIHTNIFPNRRGNWKRLECDRGFEYFSLVALTNITFNHKVSCLVSYHPKKNECLTLS
jgi:hypothetical protein